MQKKQTYERFIQGTDCKSAPASDVYTPSGELTRTVLDAENLPIRSVFDRYGRIPRWRGFTIRANIDKFDKNKME